jgi:exopolyphosphatase/guanosine-5'-triphosphate,3'-diphosphate pyrophosphatase
MIEPATASHHASVRAGGPTFAAIDLGTNNCRLLVAAPAGDGFRVIDSYSRIVRLGEGLHHTGRLSSLAMGRAMDALHICAARLARRPVRSLRAIATEACRRAANGPEFLHRVAAETGLHLDVISPREEAELALESCAPLLDGPPLDRTAPGARRALLVDIGGGSTELAWVRLPPAGSPDPGQPELIGYESLPMGVVTMAEQFGPAGYTAHGYEAMVAHVAAALLGFDRIHCISREIRGGGVRLLGTSGTVTTLAGVVLGLERYRRPLIDGTVMTRQAAAGAILRLRALGRPGLVQHPCIGPERADFVLPGCAIFDAIQRLWPVAEVQVADRGLREGMLLRMIRGTTSAHAPGRPGWRSSARALPFARGSASLQ